MLVVRKPHSELLPPFIIWLVLSVFAFVTISIYFLKLKFNIFCSFRKYDSPYNITQNENFVYCNHSSIKINVSNNIFKVVIESSTTLMLSHKRKNANLHLLVFNIARHYFGAGGRYVRGLS